MSNTANDKKNTYEKTHLNIEGYYVVWNDVYIEYWAHSDKNETKRKPTYYICCTNIFDGTLCEISLTQDEGDCSSGWTTASWGVMKFIKVSKFREKLEYVPRSIPARIKINVREDSNDFRYKFKSSYFEYDRYGFDEYYPNGDFIINHEKFKKNESKDQKPQFDSDKESNDSDNESNDSDNESSK
jgi:hypothetical protein